MSEMKEDVVLTTNEATRYLKISKPTLLKHIRHGKIKAVKVGREWRFLQSELYQFLKEGGISYVRQNPQGSKTP